MKKESKYPMVNMTEAFRIVLDNTEAPKKKTKVPLSTSLGHILATDVISNCEIPPFPASIMDGYAVRSADLPGDLPVLIDINAGGNVPESFELQEKQVARIMTGAPVPKGGDAVVKVEDTLLLPNGHVRFSKGISAGKFIRKVGSDLSRGQLVLAAGERIGPAEVGLLATCGVPSVEVYKPVKVGVLSTGDELVPVEGGELGNGQIRDSNRPMLLAAVEYYLNIHGELNDNGVVDLGIAKDTEPGQIESKFNEVIEKHHCDIILTTGGVSMGELDLVKPLLEKIGTVHFGRIHMKPGKPTTFATIERKEDKAKVLVFGLPGNPVSALVTFQLLVFPVLKKLSGARSGDNQDNWFFPQVRVKLGHSFNLDKVRPEYHRAQVKFHDNSNTEQNGLGYYEARSTGEQRSSRLLSFRTANALLILPQAEKDGKSVLEKGEVVSAYLLP